MRDSKASCSVLQSLIVELDSFRSSKQFSERIPQPLRKSISRAIDEGIGAKDVRKFLKIGDAQIKASMPGKPPDDKLAAKRVETRALNVIPTPLSSGSVPNLRISYKNWRLLFEISF